MPSDLPATLISSPAYAISTRRAHEGLTWIVLLCVYGAWLGLTYYATQLPWWLLMVTGGYVVCLHGSLQHEAVHGHLTGKSAWNAALMVWPLSLWIPFTRYRTLHQVHHECPSLTDPVEDPESFYWTKGEWQSLDALRRGIAMVNQTLTGRLLLGPFLVMPTYWYREAKRIAAGDRQVGLEWLVHLLAGAAVLGWVSGVCGLPVWQYLVLFVWPAMSLTLLRSYAEHRPGDANEERTAVIEGSPVTRLLFLNNNFHLVHHQHPELPWYAIRKLFLARRTEWLERNGEFYFKSYWELARRFAFRAKDHPVHSG